MIGGAVGESPLHIAARIEESRGEKCTKMLLKSGADTNLALSDGKTPLHISAESGTIAVFRHLLTNGADPWKQDKVGFIEDFHDRTTSLLYNPVKRIFYCPVMILGWRNRTP